jgi:hypothetical protein
LERLAPLVSCKNLISIHVLLNQQIGRLNGFEEDFDMEDGKIKARHLRPSQKPCLYVRKSFVYSDFTNRPDQKSNDLNPGDSANPDTAIKFLLFAQI